MTVIFRHMLIALLVLMGASVVSAGNSEQDFLRAQQSYDKIQASPKLQRHRDQWQAVIQRLQKAEKAHPEDSRAANASLLAARSYHGLYLVSRLKDDARQAVAACDDTAERYAGTPQAGEALYLAGQILERPLADLSQAYLRYVRFVDRYPAATQVEGARLRLSALKDFSPLRTVTAQNPFQSSAAVGNSELSSIRFWSNQGYTRVVLNLSRKGTYKTCLLPADPKGGNGPRLVIDLPGSLAGAGVMETQDVADGLLRQIRTGRPEPGLLRVVLDLQSYKKYEIFPLADPFRIIIDITGEGKATVDKSAPLPPPVDRIAQLVEQAPVEAPLKLSLPVAAKEGSKRRIVIDAGHGGKDPGAIGPSGLMEKHVVLALAKTLGKRVEEDLGWEVIYTRKDDTYLPLEERTAIANEAGADLFISLHVNANTKETAHGIETYYLNFSKNEQAAAVAARENGISLQQVGDLELILLDLMAHSKINESSRLAGEIQRSLIDGLAGSFDQIRDLGVRQGPFYVLLGATMPSVLVESAFISNKVEESRLTDRRYQEQTAEAILRGVRNYAAAHKLIAQR